MKENEVNDLRDEDNAEERRRSEAASISEGAPFDLPSSAIGEDDEASVSSSEPVELLVTIEVTIDELSDEVLAHILGMCDF